MSVAEKLSRKAPAVDSRQVRLTLKHLSVASIGKIAFLVGCVLGIVQLVATVVVFLLLKATGGIDALNAGLASALGSTTATSSLSSLLTFGNVMVIALLLAFLGVVGATLAGVVGALLYNAGVRVSDGLRVGFTNA